MRWCAAHPDPGNRGVRASRGRGSIRVSWRGVPGAVRYEVLVKLADHSQMFRVVRRTHVTIADPAARTRGRILVDAVGVDGGRGKVRTVNLPRARRTRQASAIIKVAPPVAKFPTSAPAA
jgi:hypothetical protein